MKKQYRVLGALMISILLSAGIFGIFLKVLFISFVRNIFLEDFRR